MAKKKLSDEYLLGWYHARLAYQSRGSVPPHPPGVQGESTAPKVATRKQPKLLPDPVRKGAPVKKEAKKKKAKKKASKKKKK